MHPSGSTRVLRYIGGMLLGFALFNILWHLCAVALAMPGLPEPLTVYAGYGAAIQNKILTHTGASMVRVCAGLGIALAIALVAGIPMGSSPAVNRLFSPLLYFSYPLPKLALLPVVMLVLGIGEASKITIIVLIIVFQLIISIRDAIRSIPAENYALLVSLKAGPLDIARHVTFPAVLPEVFSSMRISIGMALSALFFTESYGTNLGLGFYITDCWMRLDYIQMYFGLATLAFSGFFLFLLFDGAERVFCRWKRVR